MDVTGVNRYMRDAKAKCIAEGASEMHYAIIANQLFHGVGSLVRAGIGREIMTMSELLHQHITSADMVVHALSRDLDRTVLITRHRPGDYRARNARQYQPVPAAGRKPRTSRRRRAAILAKNRVEVIYASNGLGLAGVVLTTLHPMGAVEDYLYVIEDAGDRYAGL